MHWQCSRCGEVHEGLPLDWAYDRPYAWEGPRSADDHLGEDLCTWTDDAGEPGFFIRGLLPIPVRDTGEVLNYGVWSSLSRRSYDRIVELWDEDERVSEPPYFGYLSNALPGYPPTLGLQLAVVTRSVELRPTFVLQPGDHPLIDEQWQGIDTVRVLELAEINFH